LSVDASGTHVGAVLQQDVAGCWAPLSFSPKKLSPAESKYSAFDRELYAAYSALRHFRFLLEGKEFILFTDHKPLTHALFRTSPPWSAMQQRRLAFLAGFNCD
ncbi:Ty3/Gypsy family RNase HI domain-containing protein, partial [Klebsiella aerogenes]|nr:Ty3/Gypsy family RNase HI domain-containing protein [Klebsiella aerogenes]